MNSSIASMSFASTISTVKINERTALLLEESQKQSEELSSQEEEMRQNMEEMQATQEEAARKELEMRDTIDAINNTVGTIEMDMDGNIISTNELFAQMLQTSTSNIIGKKHDMLFSAEYTDQEEIFEMWQNLRNGIPCEKDNKYNSVQGDVWLHISYTPFKNNEGEYDKILALVINNTENKLLEIKLNEDTEKLTSKEEELNKFIEEANSEKEMLKKEIEEANKKIESLEK